MIRGAIMDIIGSKLSVFDVYKVAVEGESVAINHEQLQKVKASFERIQEWGAARIPIYGVNTGFGELIHMIIPPKFKSELQRNLLCSHAAGSGPPFPDEIVRAIMTVRLNCLMKGYSGVSPQAVQLMQELLNRRIHPVIPQQGSLGASGDLAPLSHMALPLIGEGYVRSNGQTRAAIEVLAQEELKPLELGFKEGLALVNGTSAMTGVACVAIVRASMLLRLALVASAAVVQCLGASTRPFEHKGHVLKNHSGQIVIARIMRELLAGSGLTRDHSDIIKLLYQETAHQNDVVDTTTYLQDAYSLRCMPQVLGPILETLNFCRRIVEEEVNSTNDNPLIFDSPEETFHGANFHGQYVAMNCDFLNIALTEIGVLAERQLNRLIDPHLNGKLPPFLACGESGLFCGFEGGQYLATSIAAEDLDLAAPSSIKSIPSNGSNQDIVSMGLISARKSLQLCENVTTILSVLIAACHQAALLIGPEDFSAPIRQLHQDLLGAIPQYRDSFPLDQLISQVRETLMSVRGWHYLNTQIDLGNQEQAP